MKEPQNRPTFKERIELCALSASKVMQKALASVTQQTRRDLYTGIALAGMSAFPFLARDQSESSRPQDMVIQLDPSFGDLEWDTAIADVEDKLSQWAGNDEVRRGIADALLEQCRIRHQEAKMSMSLAGQNTFESGSEFSSRKEPSACLSMLLSNNGFIVQ